MAQKVIGIADLAVGKAEDTLVTYALGSCVGVSLWDADKKQGGLVHIMLPSSRENSNPSDNFRKFADTGIGELIQSLGLIGSQKSSLVAKIAGGAKMFATNNSLFNIGERNVEQVRRYLQLMRIPLKAHDTGLDYGRTVFFHVDTGILEVKATNKKNLML
ncbi:MAG: chemotaxis protein CheD [Ruminococcus sp.]|jgi:chemotaxis protein CheD|nr:chemotaxis protein CheD [Ruminococcus sp.]